MWELRLSQFLFKPESLFVKIFECIGEAPALIPFAFIAVVLFRIMTKKEWNKGDVYFSLYLVLVVLVTATLTFVLKKVVGRTRFYDLTAPDYLGYTRFYVRGQGGESFPSGHAAMSTLSVLFYDIEKRYRIFKNDGFVLAVCVSFATLTSFSRLVAGAHFLTDLIVGVAIALTTRFLLKIALKKLVYKSS